VHFAVYEAAKRWLGSSAETGFAGAALSGATATIVSDACMTPFDVIKQRLQARVLSVCLLSEDIMICFLALYLQRSSKRMRTMQKSKWTMRLSESIAGPQLDCDCLAAVHAHIAVHASRARELTSYLPSRWRTAPTAALWTA
jgi:hypothetical protein